MEPGNPMLPANQDGSLERPSRFAKTYPITDRPSRPNIDVGQAPYFSPASTARSVSSQGYHSLTPQAADELLGRFEQQPVCVRLIILEEIKLVPFISSQPWK